MFDVETERAQNTDRQALFTEIGWRAKHRFGSQRNPKTQRKNSPKNSLRAPAQRSVTTGPRRSGRRCVSVVSEMCGVCRRGSVCLPSQTPQGACASRGLPAPGNAAPLSAALVGPCLLQRGQGNTVRADYGSTSTQ